MGGGEGSRLTVSLTVKYPYFFLTTSLRFVHQLFNQTEQQHLKTVKVSEQVPKRPRDRHPPQRLKYNFYRTQVSLGSDLWVMISPTPYNTIC